ncbi:IclR family transcriptional regulator [Alteromonas sp. 76-1]|jgi:DNA-binding IclR family transcriptional regulator|uniref:IclR family transcriptional regulator n=1 Tax=Alteromonas sp. 76-1 TaxID=2358187 RepID=UPI000FD163CD|nr:IclR family transcriptional regulator C-terminal domain-containing protein [Alteromonas sp. 76-1]VEL95168.1 IclR family transcriptional regulator [Alteromonas sp. 76-1]
METLKAKSKAPAVDASILMMNLIATSSYPLTLSEICSQLDMPPASGHRIINALLEHQMIALDPNRKKAYCIGSKIFQIASTIYNKQSIIPFFYPVAEILKNEIHKSIFLYSPVGNRVVTVAKVDSSLSGPLTFHLGQTTAMHCSASGVAILSMQSSALQKNYFDVEEKHDPSISQQLPKIHEELARAKRLGYAVTQRENGSHYCCIAAPVLNLRNEPIAAISVVINADFLSKQSARDYSKNLVQAARQLSAHIV